MSRPMMKPNAHSVKNVRCSLGKMQPRKHEVTKKEETGSFSCFRVFVANVGFRPYVMRRSGWLPQVGEIQFPRMPKVFVAVALAIAAVAAAQPARRAASLVIVGGTVITENAARQV